MSKTTLPRFVIYQTNKNEFHICLEVKGKFFRWSSKYTPTLDVNFPREVTRIEDMPIKNRPRKGIFDEGTYALTQSKSDTKDIIEEKIFRGVDSKSLSFVLQGKLLKGRFAFKRSKSSTVLQKFKDKFAKDEDVLSGDLLRTINTMIPDYDESKVILNYTPKPRSKKMEVPKHEPEEEVTADKTVRNTDYHFAFYTSGDGGEICLVTNADDENLVLRKEKNRWVLLLPVSRTVLKKEDEFTRHAKALYDIHE